MDETGFRMCPVAVFVVTVESVGSDVSVTHMLRVVGNWILLAWRLRGPLVVRTVTTASGYPALAVNTLEVNSCLNIFTQNRSPCS